MQAARGNAATTAPRTLFLVLTNNNEQNTNQILQNICVKKEVSKKEVIYSTIPYFRGFCCSCKGSLTVDHQCYGDEIWTTEVYSGLNLFPHFPPRWKFPDINTVNSFLVTVLILRTITNTIKVADSFSSTAISVQSQN